MNTLLTALLYINMCVLTITIVAVAAKVCLLLGAKAEVAFAQAEGIKKANSKA